VVPAKLVAAWGIGTDDREDFLRLSVDDIRWL
jgi:phenylalanyl-tRNA synthetase alpha subunit